MPCEQCNRVCAKPILLSSALQGGQGTASKRVHASSFSLYAIHMCAYHKISVQVIAGISGSIASDASGHQPGLMVQII